MSSNPSVNLTAHSSLRENMIVFETMIDANEIPGIERSIIDKAKSYTEFSDDFNRYVKEGKLEPEGKITDFSNGAFCVKLQYLQPKNLKVKVEIINTPSFKLMAHWTCPVCNNKNHHVRDGGGDLECDKCGARFDLPLAQPPR